VDVWITITLEVVALPFRTRVRDQWQNSNDRLKICFREGLLTGTLPGKSRILSLPKITDARGNLSFVHEIEHVPFEFKRVYYLYDVPAGAERGGHAHKQLHQFIIAVSGSFEVKLSDGSEEVSYTLSRPFEGLYVAPMTWRDLLNFSSGSVCLVLASAHFDESDYIRSFEDYRALVVPQ